MKNSQKAQRELDADYMKLEGNNSTTTIEKTRVVWNAYMIEQCNDANGS